MMKTFAILIVTMGLAVPRLSGRDESTDFWIHETPENTPDIAGAIVKTKKAMEEKLKECKWTKALPQVDWTEDYAMIISPRNFDKDGDLKFYGLHKIRPISPIGRSQLPRPKPDYELRFGWKLIQRIDGRQVFSDGTVVNTSGSSRPGKHATLVVSFKKSFVDTSTLKVKNRGRVSPIDDADRGRRRQ